MTALLTALTSLFERISETVTIAAIAGTICVVTGHVGMALLQRI